MKRVTMTELAKRAPQVVAQAENEGIIEIVRATPVAVADGGARAVEGVAFVVSAADMRDLVTRLRCARDFSRDGYPATATSELHKALALLGVSE